MNLTKNSITYLSISSKPTIALANSYCEKQLIVRACLDSSQSSIRVDEKLSKVFYINTGLEQGDALYSVLFNILMKTVVKTAIPQMQIFRSHVSQMGLVYADDIDLLRGSTVDTIISSSSS